MSIAVVCAFLSLGAFCAILILRVRTLLKENAELAKDLRESLDTAKSFKSDFDTLQNNFEILQNKFRDNPSYECQQLLADLLMGNALFRIERLSPENILLRRS